VNKPTLVIAPNKTLAAQLYKRVPHVLPGERRTVLSHATTTTTSRGVRASTDTYIEKTRRSRRDRQDAPCGTKALLSRNDVLVVASVSCIYGLGSPARYFDMLVLLERGAETERDAMLRKLVDMQYERNDYDFHRGTFRVRGDVVGDLPGLRETKAIRVELFGDTVEALCEIDPLRGKVMRPARAGRGLSREPLRRDRRGDEAAVTSMPRRAPGALTSCATSGSSSRRSGSSSGRQYDPRAARRDGLLPRIENYSRHLDGRAPATRPTRCSTTPTTTSS